MESPTLMQRLRILFNPKAVELEYQPVETEYGGVCNDNDVRRPVLVVPDECFPDEQQFSWSEYFVFLLLGIAMLWGWNMYLSAAPYFQSRFADNKMILARFQSAITSVSCVTNLVSMMALTQLQLKANYPKRIKMGLIISFVVFSLCSISTSHFRGVSTQLYFAFTLFSVFLTSVATGLCQNGTFAFAAKIGRPEYIQAVMTGQGIAGVLPSLSQIISVLAIPDSKKSVELDEKSSSAIDGTSSAAMSYFITASVVSLFALIAVLPLIQKHNRRPLYDILSSSTNHQEAGRSKRKVVSMWMLYKKLKWLSMSIFLCLAITMFFPVFTARIVSVIPEDRASPMFRRAAFIPLGFLCWNLGDFGGRVLTLSPLGRWQIRPENLFFLTCLRIVFIPAYFLCNIGGHGAKINSDFFYLIFVSGGFGVTNGFLSSLCLMIAPQYVTVAEREATGGFMVVNLLAGLTFGSLLSFAASGVGI